MASREDRKPPTLRADVKHYFDVLENLEKRAATPSEPETRKLDIEQEIAREQKIKNDNAEQDIALKSLTLKLLFSFLAIETVLVFIFSFLQGLHTHGFALEDWSFRILVSATILQITAMLFAAVRYLYPKDRR